MKAIYIAEDDREVKNLAKANDMAMKLDLYPLFLLILYGFLCFYVLFGCKAKKNTVERTYVSDTLRTASITYKSEPIQSNYTIDLICDTITGKVKPVNFKESSGDNSASLIIENNQLKALLEVAETESKIEKKEKSKTKKKFKTKEIVRYKTPLWMWIVIIVESLIIFLLIRFN